MTPCPTGTYSYTVKSGDTLWKLANQFHTTIQAIASVNPMLDINNLYIGQVICIPGQNVYPMPAPTPYGHSCIGRSEQVPNGQMPGVQMPGGQVPNGQMPGVQMPSSQIPGSQMPGGQMSGGQMSGGQMSGGQMPGNQIPNIQLPGVQMPGSQVPGGQLPGVQMPGNQMPGVQMLHDQMRLLWTQHVYWTRMVVSGLVFGLPDAKFTTDRLLQNPNDFEMVLRPFYGDSVSSEFAKLFTSHLVIASDLVKAAIAGDRETAEKTEGQWYRNADQIAEFLAGINPYWSADQWRKMLYDHLAMLKEEAVSMIEQRYEDGIRIFDYIEREALMMADMMTQGLSMQFPQ